MLYAKTHVSQSVVRIDTGANSLNNIKSWKPFLKEDLLFHYFLIAADWLILGFILGCIYYTVYRIPGFKKLSKKTKFFVLLGFAILLSTKILNLYSTFVQ